MKRKLDESNVPTPATSIDDPTGEVSQEASPTTSTSNFNSFGLEPRILQAIAQEGFTIPTPIQVKAIPVALEGKDILARSKTGSGKTAAYVLPILQSILQEKNANGAKKATSTLILVPTRELAQQVTSTVSRFSTFCSKDVRTINLTQKIPDTVQRSLLAELPDIVVATPARAAQNIQNSALSVDGLTHLVIDEADLVLSYGYEEDLRAIAEATSRGLQTCVMSATLTAEVDALKGLFCRDPVVLEIQDRKEDGGGISQYVVKCAEEEKFLLAYVIFKLKLIKGKSIVFVADIDRCYRLKLFLEQFGIKSCVLNSELPVNSRIHVVDEFNKNIYDIIIAADENEVLEPRETRSVAPVETPADAGAAPKEDLGTLDDGVANNVETLGLEEEAISTEKGLFSNSRQKRKKSKEYGVSRGIDFQNVSMVLNFDLPTDSKSYTHRIGRTARAGKTGMALSFAIPRELYRKHPSTTLASTKHDEEVLERITRHQGSKGKELKPYHFDMKQVDAFRYRMTDALKAVTRIAVREARTRELRQELLNSEKLKRHFEENPEDLYHLRHDRELRAARVQQHLKHVPDYLMPSNGNKGIAGEEVGFVGLRKTTDNRIRKARMQNRMKGKGRKASVKKSDPLRTFNAKGRR